MSESAAVVRPTARLVGAGWGLIAAGIALLVLAWFLGGNNRTFQDVLAPLGWAALAGGIGLAIWAAVRKAQNRDALQARQAQER